MILSYNYHFISNRFFLSGNLVEMSGQQAVINLPTVSDTSLNIMASSTSVDIDALKMEIYNTLYPVGTIYTSMTNTSPATLFGFGTWEQIVDRFLYCSDSSGTTGGEAEHTLTHAELPYSKVMLIRNVQDNYDGITVSSGLTKIQVDHLKSRFYIESSVGWDLGLQDVGFEFGSNQPHSIMPPYITVYCWKRTA